MPGVIITDDNFESEVLNTNVPVLVDFYADWCGPCKMQAPIIEQLAEAYHNKPVKIAKLNVDEAPKSAQQFGVMSIPTLLIFKGGKQVEQFVGIQDKETLSAKLDHYSA